MANWGAFSEGFNSGFTQAEDRKQKEKQLQQEQLYRLAALKYQQMLDAQTPTPEMKNAMGFGFGTTQEGLQKYRQALDPNAQAEMALKNQMGALENWKARYGMWKDQYGATTGRQKDFQYLMSLPGMSQEKALQYLFRPDMMTQFINSGGWGQ